MVVIFYFTIDTTIGQGDIYRKVTTLSSSLSSLLSLYEKVLKFKDFSHRCMERSI